MRPRWVILVPLLAAFAAQPPGLEPQAGTATFTDLTGGGTCTLLGEPPDNLHVGLSSAEFGTADVCGAYLDVTGPNGTVRVQITDRCPRCPAGLVDLSRTAFAMIADADAGRAPVTYSLARNPPIAETIALRIKSGSSADWMQIQALDHGNPLARVEIATPEGGWRSLQRTRDNFWTAARPGPGAGPFTVRLTDVFGLSATIENVALAPAVVQRSADRLYPSEPTPAVVGPTTSAPSATLEEVVPLPETTAGRDATRTESDTGSETAGGSDRQSRGRVGPADRGRGAGGGRTGDAAGEASSGGGILAMFGLLVVLVGLARFVSSRRHRRQHHRLR